jgi:hypothetical protein
MCEATGISKYSGYTNFQKKMTSVWPLSVAQKTVFERFFLFINLLDHGKTLGLGSETSFLHQPSTSTSKLQLITFKFKSTAFGILDE